MGIIFWSTMASIVFYAFSLYLEDEITVGLILAYLDYMIMLMMNFGMVVAVIAQMGFMFGAADKVMMLMMYKPKVNMEGGEKLSDDTLKGEIELKDVHFKYPSRDDVPVLKGVSFKVDHE